MVRPSERDPCESCEIILYASYAALVACFTGAGRSGAGLALLLALFPIGGVLVWSHLALSQIALPYTSEGVVNAGHLPVNLLAPAGVTLLGGHGTPLGLLPHAVRTNRSPGLPNC